MNCANLNNFLDRLICEAKQKAFSIVSGMKKIVVKVDRNVSERKSFGEIIKIKHREQQARGM